MTAPTYDAPQPAPFGPIGGPAVQPTTLGHALRSEWTKIRTVRSTVWTLGVMFAVVVGVDMLVTLALNGAYVGLPLLSSGLFGLMLGQLAVISLGVLVITSEYATGMIRATLTACPKRSLVLTAKAIVFFGLSFVMTTVACTTTALVNWWALSDQTIPSYAGDDPLMRGSVDGTRIVAGVGQWLGATVGAGLYVALLGLLSLAVGTILRHTAGAVTIMIGVVLLPLIMALFMVSDSLSPVRDVLVRYSVLNGLASLYQIPMAETGNATGWSGVGLLAVVTAIVLAGAYATLEKRDV
jgi:ABC-2 family transporter protein